MNANIMRIKDKKRYLENEILVYYNTTFQVLIINLNYTDPNESDPYYDKYSD